ncbi:MAG: FAD-dependent oxidoreductase [Candidatus Spyradocola sp.]|jgi:hypothetical protein
MHKREDVDALLPHAGGDYDVLVAGAGPAGFGAALAASALGARTLLLEARGFPGGVAATSLWMPINRLKLDGGSRGGVHERLVRRLESFGPDACREGKTTWTDGDGLHVHPDYLKEAMLELLEESGCHYRLYSPVVGARTENGVVRAALVGTPGETQAFSAKVLIDCTGDGVLSYHAGAKTQVGSEADGRMMPITLGFALGNVDEEALFAFYDQKNTEMSLAQVIQAGRERGLAMSSWYSFDRTTIPGVVSVNNGGISGPDGRLNALDPADRTFAQRIGLRIALDFVHLARELPIPGLAHCSLVETGAAVGVRETRRVLCDYVVTLEDAERCARFPDVVARRYGAVDQAGLADGEKGERPAMQSGYDFPYRALLAQGLEGLLVAGRCGSYTHMGLAAGKSMGNMMAIGQAAGAAAARACALGCTPRALPYAEVRAALETLGARL